jgi:hypothetical protein
MLNSLNDVQPVNEVKCYYYLADNNLKIKLKPGIRYLILPRADADPMDKFKSGNWLIIPQL